MGRKDYSARHDEAIAKMVRDGARMKDIKTRFRMKWQAVMNRIDAMGMREFYKAGVEKRESPNADASLENARRKFAGTAAAIEAGATALDLAREHNVAREAIWYRARALGLSEKLSENTSAAKAAAKLNAKARAVARAEAASKRKQDYAALVYADNAGQRARARELLARGVKVTAVAAQLRMPYREVVALLEVRI